MVSKAVRSLPHTSPKESAIQFNPCSMGRANAAEENFLRPISSQLDVNPCLYSIKRDQCRHTSRALWRGVERGTRDKETRMAVCGAHPLNPDHLAGDIAREGSA